MHRWHRSFCDAAFPVPGCINQRWTENLPWHVLCSEGETVTRARVIRFAVVALCVLTAAIALAQANKPAAASAKEPSKQVQDALIALDKQWGEAGGKGDNATLNKILADSYMGIGEKGEALSKQEQVASTNATASTVQNASYTADEYKFEALSPSIIVMTHRATVKGMQDGKEATESHRSLHVFQK